MSHACMVSLTSLIKGYLHFPSCIDLNWKNSSVVDAARPPHNNISEKVLAVDKSLHNNAVITLPIHVV